MIVPTLVHKLLLITCIIKQIKGLLVSKPSTTEYGFLLRRYGPVTHFCSENETFLSELSVFSTMPKRLNSRSEQTSKKAKETFGFPFNKRTSIPRSCKSTISKKKKKSIIDFNFLSIPSSKIVMGASQMKPTVNEKTKKKEKQKVETYSSDEELDVVFDVQEEKKNKIYEVITVMSDDETPNKITYERLYADEPEKTVEKSEIINNSVDIDILNDSDIVSEVVKEVARIKNEVTNTESNDVNVEKVPVCENVAPVSVSSKSDSDSDIVCVAVLDAKTKAEQKTAAIEEICLSSDSESETRPTVPPIRIQLPVSSYPYINKFRHTDKRDYSFESNDKFRHSDKSEDSFGSNNSNAQLKFRRTRLYPYVYDNKQMDLPNSMFDREPYSASSKASSSDEFPLVSPESPSSPSRENTVNASGNESSSSILSDLSQTQHNTSTSDNENSSPSSSSDEENDIYWKADRESRRKEELRYEELTDLGRKMQKGEAEVNGSNFIFKVMSYNVLSQGLLQEHMYLYKSNDKRALGWARRWSLIYNEIKDENPEILCLQEVEQSQVVTHYAKLHDLGYRWVYKKRTSNYYDGVAVFYKASLFEAEEHSLVEFYQPGVSVLDRDNVGVVVRLRLRDAPSHAIVIATTHLLYNPKRSDVKLAQLQVLLAEIDKLAYNKDTLTYYPVILTGDFNLKPRNGVYKLMTEGELNYEGKSRKTMRRAEDRNYLPKTLLPCRLGVTDRCQHATVLEARIRGENCSKTKLYHSEGNTDPQQDINYNDDCSRDDRFESGTLWHGFNFQSVYPHVQADGQKEASTHHDSWITVDYIFYSTPKTKEGQKKEEGSLQLLSRLRLPTQDECDRFLRHIPNFAFGSDHLPLVGKFLLRLH